MHANLEILKGTIMDRVDLDFMLAVGMSWTLPSMQALTLRQKKDSECMLCKDYYPTNPKSQYLNQPRSETCCC